VRIACIFSAAPGTGGLGVQADNVLASLARVPGSSVIALGPSPGDAARSRLLANIEWVPPPRTWSEEAKRVPGLRAHAGALAQRYAEHLGRWAAERLRHDPPLLCYAFSQVAFESFEWCTDHAVPTVLESPNGHIDNFRRVYIEEHAAWCGGRYLGHPTERMCSRVKHEYALARHIRASSTWTVESLASGGVPRERLVKLEQPVDLARYRPADARGRSGPLRVCFVGSLDLRKGFVYLLDAVGALGEKAFWLEMVGATGDRCCRRLLAGHLPVNATCAPGDPRPAYTRADVFVLPTLEDGSPFAVAEAMASGLPVIVTSDCGAAEWISAGTGWVIPPRDVPALRGALHDALVRRADLPRMGRAARASTESRAGEHCYQALADWVSSLLQ
jgi:glycosyltransferase involved in cell wall biosynthesis